MDKKKLSERDICSKYITPALVTSRWDINNQVREEVTFTLGRIHVKGKLASRGKFKRADYILYYKPNLPLAVIEAKDNNHLNGAFEGKYAEEAAQGISLDEKQVSKEVSI